MLEIVSARFGQREQHGRDVAGVLRGLQTCAGLLLKGSDGWMYRLFENVTDFEESGVAAELAGSLYELRVDFAFGGALRRIALPASAPVLGIAAVRDPAGAELPCGGENLELEAGGALARPEVAIMTSKREPSYVHETVASVLLSGLLEPGPGGDRGRRLHLVCGSQDCSYLSPYAAHRLARVVPLSDEELASLHGRSIRKRSNLNYIRCLSVHPLATRGEPEEEDHAHYRRPGSGLLVLEDDVVLEDRFLEHFWAAVRAAEARYPCYILVLYTKADRGPRLYSFSPGARSWAPVDPVSHWVSEPSDYFWGTQAMYFPPCALLGVAGFYRYFFEKPDTEWDFPYDAMADFYSKTRGYPLVVAAKSSVQHVGMKSTGLSRGDHWAATWDPTFEADGVVFAGDVPPLQGPQP
eukprot:tig00020563_g11356.t1